MSSNKTIRWNIVFFTTLLCLLLGAPLCLLATGSEEAAVTLQKRYQNITSIEFIFDQQTMNAGRLRRGNGSGMFLRHSSPHTGQGKAQVSTVMRWDYVSPTKQIILNTGKELSIYTEEDKQLIITSANDLESDITFALFSGQINILDLFTVASSQATAPSDTQAPALSSIILLPKDSHPQVQRLQIWFSSDFVIHKLSMEDHFGSVTTLILTDIQINTMNPDDPEQLSAILALSVPDDTEVIRQ